MIILLLMVLLPFLGAALTLLFNKRYGHIISIVFSGALLLLTIAAVYLASTNGLSSVNFSYSYIPALNLLFNLQFTSLTLILALMTSIVFFAASIVGHYFIKDSRIYNMIFLLAEGGAIGVFLSANLFLLYLFWEVSEFMMFFMIFIYGGYDRKYAAIKFIIYSLLSSLLLLIAIMLLYVNATPNTFDINTLIASGAMIPHNVQIALLVLLTFAFMIKMPVFPFHTWLPDAHTEAPTTGSMILAGVLLKFGGYGLLLMFLIVPLAHTYSLYLAMVFGFSAIYSAIVTLKQANIKRLIAYTSITDMGIIAFGIAASNSFGTSGALYAMLGHALAISILFLVAGAIDEAYGTLDISKVKGVIVRFPELAFLFIAGVVAAIGIPLTAGFIGDLLIFIGGFKAFGLPGIVPLAGIFIIGAALFWLVERVFFNTSKPTEPYKILGRSVALSGLFLLGSTIVIGVLPFLLSGVSGL